MTEQATSLDCCACGACCASQWDEEHYVALTPEEVRKLSEWKQVHWVHYDRTDFVEEFPALRTKKNSQGHIVCIAFRGKIGSKCRCSIYEDRPKPCSHFRPGSPECRDARQEANLE
jgi:Fe-S-cluster containining protein